jgi:hypothetical protein
MTGRDAGAGFGGYAPGTDGLVGRSVEALVQAIGVLRDACASPVQRLRYNTALNVIGEVSHDKPRTVTFDDAVLYLSLDDDEE